MKYKGTNSAQHSTQRTVQRTHLSHQQGIPLSGQTASIHTLLVLKDYVEVASKETSRRHVLQGVV